MIRIAPTAAERRAGTLAPANLERACAALIDDGVVVLEQVIDAGPLDALKERMDRDSAELLEFCASVGGNPRDRGHLQQGPPPVLEFVPSQLVANTYAAQVLSAVLGSGAYCEFYNGNTNCPGSVRQQLHLDAAHVDPLASVAAPTRGVVLNVVPQDVDEHNGAVELWPGSHRVVVPTPVRARAIAARRRVTPPVRGAMRKGDILLRDSRLWHRGVPNKSTEYRHMIGLVFVSGDVPKRRPLRFARDCAALLAAAPIPFFAEFTAEPIDYLLGPTKFILRRLQGPDAARVTRH